jgi:ketosteroid isomerase-like protein
MLIKMLVVLAGVAMAAEDLEKQVICAETGFSRAAEARDRDAFIRSIHPDARFVSGRVARGSEDIADAWSAILAPGGTSIRWRPAVVEVSADGTLALSRGPYRTVSVEPDGSTTVTWGHFNSMWRRQPDGHWLVMFDVGGDAGMTPTAEEVAILEGEPDCD